MRPSLPLLRRGPSRGLRLTSAALLCIAVGLVWGALTPAQAQEESEGTVALVGGEVRLGDGRVLPRATVLVRGGRIEAVGEDVVVPAGARAIDCAGKIVTPV